MKKILRALAVILTLCVLVGAVVIVASAETTSQLDASQYGAGIKNLIADEAGMNFKSFGGVSRVVYNTSKVTANGNTYSKYTRNSNYRTYDEMSASKLVIKKYEQYEYENGFYGTSVTATSLANYDYLVWSLDFMTDSVDENGKLNYLNESWFGTYGNAYYYNYIVADSERNWYMSSDAQYSENDAPLATEPGAWNNLTVVANKATGSMYAFANGRHFYTKTGVGSLKIDRIVYNIWSSNDIYNESWTMSVDNVSFNAYGPSYTSTVSYGLDDYFKNLDLTKYISECGDIVYNSNYKFAPSSNSASYTVFQGDEAEVYTDHYEIACLIPGLCEGDSIIADVTLDNLIKEAGLSYVRAEKGYSYYYLITGYAEDQNENIIEGTLVNRGPAGTTSSFVYYYDGIGDSYIPATSFQKNFFGIKSGVEYTTPVGNTHWNYYLAPMGGSGASSYPTSANYKYVTMDFAVSASGYVYLPEDNTDGIYRYTGTLSGLTEKELATAKLSYWENSSISILSNQWDFEWFYVSNEGKWYLSTDKTYSEDDVPLADGVGEWNHITFMNEVATGKLYVFLDGKHVTTGKLKSAEFERLSFLRINNIQFSEFDIRYSNLDIKFYKNDYDSGERIFGVDDYFALNDPSTYDVSFIEDASLGINSRCYGIPESVELTRDSEIYTFKNLASALKAAATGDVLNYNGALTLYRPLNQELEELTVTSASVVLTADAATLHDYADGVITRKSIFFATWYDEEGNEIKTELVAIDTIPDPSVLSFDTAVLGNYNQVSAWKWAIDGSDEYAALSTIAGVGVGEYVIIVPDTVNVAWFDTEGALLENEVWFVGSVASRDFSELEELEVFENGWYELAYFWNSNGADMTVKSGEDMGFTPIVEPVDSFTGLKYNYSLGSYFYVNHYVPVPDEDSGVTVTGARFAESCVTTGLNDAKPYFDDLTQCSSKISSYSASSVISIDGVDYYKFNNGKYVTAYAWYSLQGFEVCYTVEYNGKVYELSSKVALTRLGTKYDDKDYFNSYVYSVINNSECGSKDMALIVNLARYMSQSYAMQGSLITFTDVDTILSKHKSCDCVKSLESYLPTEAPATDPSGLAEIPGFGASYRVNHSESILVLYVPKEIVDANPDLKVKADIKGAIVDGATTLQTLTIDFVCYTQQSEPVIVTNNGVSCYIYTPMYSKNAAYNADLVYNITVSYGENEYTGTYSLATYLYNLNNKVGLYVYNSETSAYEMISGVSKFTSEQRAVQLLLAQRAYAEAARNYKLN